MTRQGCTAWLAWFSIFIGSATLALGLLLARDWLLVNHTAGLGLGLRPRLGAIVGRIFGIPLDHDVLELLVAAAAAALVLFGIGMLIGLWAATPRRHAAPGERLRG